VVMPKKANMCPSDRAIAFNVNYQPSPRDKKRTNFFIVLL